MQASKQGFVNRFGRVFFTLSIGLSMLTIYLLTDGFHLEKADVKKPIEPLDLIAYSVWLVAPPLWFMAEYVWLFPDKLDSAKFNDFKYTQELASKIWGAFVVLITAIVYYKYGQKFWP